MKFQVIKITTSNKQSVGIHPKSEVIGTFPYKRNADEFAYNQAKIFANANNTAVHEEFLAPNWINPVVYVQKNKTTIITAAFRVIPVIDPSDIKELNLSVFNEI